MENKENINRFASYIDSIFNLAAIVGLLLPLYKVADNNIFYSVPLYQFKGWLSVLYWIFPITMGICGFIQILINKSDREKAKRSINIIDVILNASAVFTLIISGQPYPAVMFFTLFLIKITVMLIKQKWHGKYRLCDAEILPFHYFFDYNFHRLQPKKLSKEK